MCYDLYGYLLWILRSVCFDVKYLQKNIFLFYGLCFAVKYLVKSKIFLVNQINL